jgi:DNA modification methylase
MKIIQIELNKLKNYANNTKKHPKEQIHKISKSISEFGFNVPILINSNFEIIAGHGRLEAAKELNLTKVPCIQIEHLSENQIKAYRIADNKTAESDWDFDLLKDEFKDLDISGYDLDLTGFGFDEIAEIMNDKNKELEDPEPDDPSRIKTDIKYGDIYQLGNHRLMCGDSTKKEDIEKLMNGNKTDMVFTDPPWNVNYGASAHPSWKRRSIINDNMPTEDFKEFMNSVFKIMNMFSKDGCMIYVVMSAQEWGNMMLTLENNNFHWSSTIIWNKDTFVLRRKDYHTKYEPIWYGWKNGKIRIHALNDRKQSDVWDIARPKNSELHPTTKPVELVARALCNSSITNSTVLDLFGGSGTTLIACDQLDRNCYMMELDSVYCQVIINRWEKLTGKKAYRLDND